MKNLSLVLAVLAFLGTTQAHYTWWRMAINEKWQYPLQYIRNVSWHLNDPEHDHRGYSDRIWETPIWTPDPKEDFRCGRKHMDYADITEIAQIEAGSTISFAPNGDEPAPWDIDNWAAHLGDNEYWDNCKDLTCISQLGIYHEGPLFAYLSKAPNNDVRSYDGSGDWFKIYQGGEVQLTEPGEYWAIKWPAIGSPYFNFTIPKATPPGEYLLRAEQIFPWYWANETQFFISCAQVEIVGEGGGTPGPLVKLPDVYLPDAPGISVSFDMYGYRVLDEGYRTPGPEVWKG